MKMPRRDQEVLLEGIRIELPIGCKLPLSKANLRTLQSILWEVSRCWKHVITRKMTVRKFYLNPGDMRGPVDVRRRVRVEIDRWN